MIVQTPSGSRSRVTRLACMVSNFSKRQILVAAAVGVSNPLLETLNEEFQVYRTSRVVLALISSEEAPT